MKALAGAIIILAGAIFWSAGVDHNGPIGGMSGLPPIGLIAVLVAVGLVFLGTITLIAGLLAPQPRISEMWPGHGDDRHPSGSR
jgi:hypothetical protein